jgi:uncharacterized protein (TIGR02300 family)
MNESWGTKRNCPSCSSHFYDLNKTPATCPKCKHQFDPAAQVRAKRKSVKREAVEEKEKPFSAIISKKSAAAKKNKGDLEDEELAGDDLGDDIAEIEDVDDIENLQDLSELEEMEDKPVNGDDADDESLIEEITSDENTLVGSVEEEEAEALIGEIEDEEEDSKAKKAKKRPK